MEHSDEYNKLFRVHKTAHELSIIASTNDRTVFNTLKLMEECSEHCSKKMQSRNKDIDMDILEKVNIAISNLCAVYEITNVAYQAAIKVEEDAYDALKAHIEN